MGIVLVLVGLLTGLLGIGPVAAEGMSLEDLAAEGARRYDAGDFRGAVVPWQRGLAEARRRQSAQAEMSFSLGLGMAHAQLAEYQQARVLLGQAILLTGHLKDQEKEAIALGTLAVVDEALGDYRAARARYEAGLKIFVTLGDRANQATAFNNLGKVDLALGNHLAAQARFEAALEIQQAIGDRAGESESLYNLGEVDLVRGNHAAARARFEASLNIAHDMGYRSVMLRSINSLGHVDRERSDYAAARTRYEAALAIARDIGDRAWEAAPLGSLGNVDLEVGDYAAARTRYEAALAITRDIGDRVGEAATLHNLGEVERALGDYAAARARYAASLQIKQALGDRAGEAMTLNNLGLVDKALGDYPSARASFEGALRLWNELGLAGTDHQQSTILNLGDLLAESDLEAAKAIFEGVNDPLRLGHYLLRTGDAASARGKFERALALSTASGGAEYQQAALIGRGLAAEALGDAAASKTDFEAVTAELEAQRAALPPGERRQYFAGTVMGFPRLDPYEGLVRVSQRLDDPAGAVSWSEHTKARALLDAIALQPSGLKLPEALAREEAELTQRIGALTKQRELALEKHNRERLDAIAQELLPLRAQLADLIARLRRSHPEYAALRYPKPVAVAELRLGADEALLIYEVTEPATYAWLIRDGRVVQSLILPLTRQALTAEIEGYRDSFQQIADSDPADRFNALRGVDPQRGAQLYRRLVADFVPQLKETRRLIIVPDEALGLLPFEALVVDAPATVTWTTTPYGPSPRGLTYLGERYRISYAQSATALMQARARAATPAAAGLLVVADPVFDERDARLLDPPAATQIARAPAPDSDQRRMMSAVQRFVGGADAVSLPRLAQTGRLSESLSPLAAPLTALVGPAAGEPAVRAALATPHRYLLFATHGLLDAELPYVLEPALALTLVGASARDPAADGFLTLTEVMSLDLPAELAVLSACRTGLGRRLSGEGVMGMGRAFQYAGTREVLMSLWSVDEAATVYFTERLFTHLKAGAAVPQALEQARADLRAAGWSHPFYWAGFILVGA